MYFEHKFPSESTWNSRRAKIDQEVERWTPGVNFAVPYDNATVCLWPELTLCYLVGAWTSVIVHACTIVDGQLRRFGDATSLIDASITKGTTSKIFARFSRSEPDSPLSPDNLSWLNKRRNQLVHPDMDEFDCELHFNDVWDERHSLFDDANQALSIAIAAMYGFVMKVDPQSIVVVAPPPELGEQAKSTFEGNL